MRFVGWTGAVTLVLLCALGAGMWDAAESEARPRNGLIAYTKETNRCDDLDCNSFVRTVRPDGRGGRRLPCSTGGKSCRDILPVFSPGGGRLATATTGIYDTTPNDSGRLRLKNVIAVRDARGRVLRRILELDEFLTGLAWSPDGARLAFNGDGPIYTVARDGTGQTLFRKTGALDVEWSRQGRLAWTGKRGGFLKVTNTARSRVRRLPAAGSSVAWSPDGRRLAYTGYTGDHQLVKTIGVDGRGRRTVTRRCTGTNVNGGGGIAWSPDGRQLLCTDARDQLLAVNVRTGRSRVVVSNRTLTPITSFDWQRAPGR